MPILRAGGVGEEEVIRPTSRLSVMPSHSHQPTAHPPRLRHPFQHPLLHLPLLFALLLLLSSSLPPINGQVDASVNWPPAPSLAELQQELVDLRHERDLWQQQKASIHSTLLTLQRQLTDLSAPPTPTPRTDVLPSDAAPTHLTIQLIDRQQIFPPSLLPSVWQTLLSLFADNSIAGNIQVAVSRLSSSPSPSTHPNPSLPDTAPTPEAPLPHTPPPWSPTALPLAHPSFPDLLVPSPTLPPYNASTPASVYQEVIRTEFLHAYGGYVRDSFPHDHYHPVHPRDDDSYHMHLTLVDALDTLLLMNLTAHYSHAFHHLSTHLTFGHQDNINVFETTIRVLGALLSCHAMTGEEWLLSAARSLGDLLLNAFASPTGVPWGTISLGSRVVYNPAWAGGASTVSELTSIQLEFQYLSRATGDPKYEDVVDAVMEVVKEAGVALYPQFMSVQDGKLQGGTITLGARVDSLYEYLLKSHSTTSHALTTRTT